MLYEVITTNAFGKILGANGTLNIAVIGCGGRATGLAQAVGRIKNARVSHICDVDEKRLDFFKNFCKENIGYIPESVKDFRTIIDNKDIDAIIVATPEHWHAPMAIMGMQAGKHVYVEKPCSHNPWENELLVAVQKKTGKICQMGNQQRSSITSALAVKEIQEGIIGDVYAAKAFYSSYNFV